MISIPDDSKTAPSTRRIELPAVNLARYAAAVFLVLFHFLPLQEIQDGAVRNLFSKGYLGTSFFFLLSGFLLTHVYASRLRNAADVPSFHIKRLARLYPSHLLALFVAFPLVFATGEKSSLNLIGGLVASLLLVQSWIPWWAGAVNGPAWSISALFFFYLVFPFALQLFRRFHKPLPFLIIVIWLAYLIPPALYQLLLPDGKVATIFTGGGWLTVLFYNPLIRLPEFLLGMGGAALFEERRFASVLQRPWALPGLLLATILIAAAIPAETPLYPLLHNGLFTPLLLLIVLALAYDESVVSRAGQSPLGRRLADSSLQIFLLHVPLFVYLFNAAQFAGWVGEKPSVPFVLLALVVVLAVAYFVDQRIMRPLSGRLVRKWQERQQATPIKTP